MIKSVNNFPVSQLLPIDAPVVYAIPRYQREYTWSKVHWEKLFDDILDNNHGYFLGSIICINQSNDTLAVQTLEVVDGQQRLTTLSLLFAAVYQSLKELENELDDDQRAELINLKHKLVLKKERDKLRLVPQIQNNNQSDYRAILSQVGIIGSCEAARYAGNRNIFRAFRYFQARIENLPADESRLPSMMAFLDKVSQACLVKIEVASHADAYTLFESLNNRGIPLTGIDLIKNKLLARLDATEPDMVDHYFEVWRRLLKALGDDYNVQERFFRHYYNAFKAELNEPFRKTDDTKRDPLGPVATRSNLINIYEKLINLDAKLHLEDLQDKGRLYSLMLPTYSSTYSDEKWVELREPLKDLERIQGTPSYLLMLYLLARQETLKLGIPHLKEIAEFLVSFFVRRNLTDTPPTHALTRLFMSSIERLAKLTEQSVVESIQRDLVDVSASDDSFREKLEGPIYQENVDVTRFLLCSLAEESMTKETMTDLWKLENKRYMWTIEHIFPQGENIPGVWVDMIAAGDRLKAKEYQQTHAHKLGNLTISAFNATLGNKSFLEKRDRTDQQGRHVGYKNGLKLNAELASAEGWSIAKIDARTRQLVDLAMSRFELP